MRVCRGLCRRYVGFSWLGALGSLFENGSMPVRIIRELANKLFEDFSAVIVSVEHVEAGKSGAQQHMPAHRGLR